MSVFRFKGRAAGSDPEGYYVTRWDLAERLSVLASTKAEATEKALAMLGDHPRYARRESFRSGAWAGWAIKWDSMDEERPVAESSSSERSA